MLDEHVWAAGRRVQWPRREHDGDGCVGEAVLSDSPEHAADSAGYTRENLAQMTRFAYDRGVCA